MITSKKVKGWLILLICIEAVFWFTTRSIFGIIHTDGPYFGKVVDAENGKPIEGAAVANVWEMEYLALVQTVTGFGDAVETVTDTEGKYYLPRIWTISIWPLSKLDRPELLVFKAGYDTHPPYMHNAWKPSDEKIRGMTQHEYQITYWIIPERAKECLVKLNKASSLEEIKKIAWWGVPVIPNKYKGKLANITKMSNYSKHVDY